MVFVILGLAIGVATVVALFSITAAMRDDLQDKIDQFGANIVIVPQASELSLSYGNIVVSGVSYDVKELSQEDVPRIKTIAFSGNIATIAPKLLGPVQAKGAGESRALLVGVDFPAELRMKKWWEINGAAPSREGEVLLGSRAAGVLMSRPGDSLAIDERKFTVAGVLKETGSQEDSVLYVELSAAQDLLGKPGKLSLIEVSALCKACPIEDIVEQISGVLPNAKVSALQQAWKARRQTVDQLTNFSLAVSAVVLAIGAMIVLTTMMSSVKERTREIGIFRAIDFRRMHIARIILLEALVVSVVGGVLGWLAGVVASSLTAPYVAQTAVTVNWNPALAALAVGLSAMVGLGSSIYPAMQAANLDPAEALRFI
jgi:putative ABC transport system permease protein